MARSWNEIQADVDNTNAALEAAQAKKEELEGEAALKALPWTLGLAALGGLVAWGFGKRADTRAEREKGAREKEEAEYERVMAERAAERSAKRAKEQEEWLAAARARSAALLAQLDADLEERLKRNAEAGA